MSRARFLADNDLKEAIILGALRREPTIEFPRLRDLGMQHRSDAEVLDFAAGQRFLVVSHDVNTMTAEAFAGVAAARPMHGLLLVHQQTPIRPIVEDLVLIWAASEAEEWVGQVRFLPL
jgi:hypothetical protein